MYWIYLLFVYSIQTWMVFFNGFFVWWPTVNHTLPSFSMYYQQASTVGLAVIWLNTIYIILKYSLNTNNNRLLLIDVKYAIANVKRIHRMIRNWRLYGKYEENTKIKTKSCFERYMAENLLHRVGRLGKMLGFTNTNSSLRWGRSRNDLLV